jgi:hypothetical protein
MGKVGSILLVAVGAAIQLVPGIGNAVGSALMSAGLGIGGAVYITGALVAAGLASALSLGASLLAPRPNVPRPESADRQVRSPIAARTYIRGRRRTYGALAFFDTSGSGVAGDVIAFNDGRAADIVRVYLNDDQVTLSGNIVQPLADERYSGSKLRVGFNMGQPTETAFSEVIGEFPAWTTDHRGDGIVTGYLLKSPATAEDFLKVYPQGDNITLSIVMDSWPLYDPRLEDQDWSDDTTWTGPFDNGVLILLWYLVIVRGEDFTARIAPKLSYWIAAADRCDSARALKAGGSEKLYRSWIMWDSTAKPHEVVGEILKTFDGWLSETEDGHLILFAGQVYAPTVAITPEQIISYEVQSFVADEDRINEVVVSYISEDHDYNTVEASSWRDEDDIADRGLVNSTSFSPQVPSHAQAQYLARRLAAMQNASSRGTISTTFAGRAIIGHRYIDLTVEEAGATFFDGLAEIISIERNTQTGGVNFSWVAADPTIDTWVPAVDEGDPAPVGDLTVLEPLETPEIDTATPSFFEYGARIALEVAGPDRDDLTWYVRWRVSTDTAWNTSTVTDEDAGTPVALITPIVPLSVDIDVQVAYGVGDGRTSNWSPTETVDTTPPP